MTDVVITNWDAPPPRSLDWERALAEHRERILEFNRQMNAWKATSPTYASECGTPVSPRWEPREVPDAPPSGGIHLSGTTAEVQEHLGAKFVITHRPMKGVSRPVETWLKPGMV